MNDANVHRKIEIVLNDVRILAPQTRLVYRLRLQIGPIDGVLEETQRERMRYAQSDDDAPIRAVHANRFNAMELDVDPVETTFDVVDGETVWPKNGLIDEGLLRLAVHRRAIDSGMGTPVGPIEPAEKETYIRTKE